jgi:hypothetical protein
VERGREHTRGPGEEENGHQHGRQTHGNTGDGVRFDSGATQNTVGGTATGVGNTIAFNQKGVLVGSSAGDNGTVGDQQVALTSYGRPEDRRRAFAVGFDHLTKPANPDDLVRLLRR